MWGGSLSTCIREEGNKRVGGREGSSGAPLCVGGHSSGGVELRVGGGWGVRLDGLVAGVFWVYVLLFLWVGDVLLCGASENRVELCCGWVDGLACSSSSWAPSLSAY